MKITSYIVVLALIFTILPGVTHCRSQGQSASVAPVKKERLSPLKDYVGRYELASGEIPITTIDVTMTKEGLWAKPSLAMKRKLVPQSKTEFLDESENARYTFTRDQSKKVVSLTFEYQGKIHTARKLEPMAPSLSGNVTFQLLGYPDANIVVVAGSFNNWNQSQKLFAKDGDRWVCRIKLEPGKYLYKFIVDGDWMADPGNPNTEDDGNGNINSVLLVTPLQKP
jgi:hypothetical protein